MTIKHNKLTVTFTSDDYSITAKYHNTEKGLKITILGKQDGLLTRHDHFKFFYSDYKTCKEVIALIQKAVDYAFMAEKILNNEI